MSAMASQITSLTIVYSTVYSGADTRKHKKNLCVTGLSAGNSPAQRVSNAENGPIWWSHNVEFEKVHVFMSTFHGFAPMALD